MPNHEAIVKPVFIQFGQAELAEEMPMTPPAFSALLDVLVQYVDVIPFQKADHLRTFLVNVSAESNALSFSNKTLVQELFLVPNTNGLGRTSICLFFN